MVPEALGPIPTLATLAALVWSAVIITRLTL